MGRFGKFILFAVTGAAVIIGVALLVQYQLRLRMVVGEPLIVGLSKSAWVECLSESELVGLIDHVGLKGITVTDRSGAFTMTNLRSEVANGSALCPALEIVVLDKARKQYFVPFRYVGGLKKNEKWFWSNPFPT